MKKLLFIICLFASFSSMGQGNYLYRATRERIIGGVDDSSRAIPRYNGTPSGLRVGSPTFAGQIAMDTINHRFYIYSGGSWLRLAKFTELISAQSLQDVTDVGNTTTQPIKIGSYVAIKDTGYGGSNRAYLQDFFGTLRWASPSTHPNMQWTLNGTSHSAARNYTLPDKSGTIALLDDISGTNIYNGDGKTTSDRTDTLDGNTLTFLGSGSNYPATPPDTVMVKNAATLFTNSLVTNRLENIVIAGNNYGSYDMTNYAGTIYFRHYGSYATGCCGKNTMQLKWFQNAAWPGGVDTIGGAVGFHNDPTDHHFYLSDLTDTWANSNRLVTHEHNGAAFVRFYNNPTGNFAQTLFGLSTNSPNYTAIPNWENWDVIVGGKFAVADTGLFNGQFKLSSGSPGSGKVLKSDANGVGTWQDPVFANTYNAQTGTTYTLQSSDNGKIVTLSNASAITLTVPASLPAGFNCTLVQLGAGQVTISPSSTTVHNRQSFTKLKGQYAMATIVMYTSDTFITQGDME